MNRTTQYYAAIEKTLAGLGLQGVKTVQHLFEVQPKPASASVSARSTAPLQPAAITTSGAAAIQQADKPDPRRRFLINRKGKPINLRVGTPLDLQADAVVHDGLLGTIGLIHLLQDTSLSSSDAIKQCIDRATYLRHLLVESLSPGAADSRSGYAVEVVFAIPQPAPSGRQSNPTIGSLIGKTLRELVSRSTALHAVGINLWNLDASVDPKTSPNVRRAFCWLLYHSGKWWPSQEPIPPEAVSVPTPLPSPIARREFGLLKEVSLTNFRLPGNRTLLLGEPGQADVLLHLVHGPNGSGKSSLAEALELAATCKIERIGSEDHSKVITNSALKSPGASATLRLEFTSGGYLEGKVGPKGIEWLHPLPASQDSTAWPQAAACEAASVRMDQKLADALSQSLPQRRAQILLNAFFSNDYQQLLKGRSAESDAAKLGADFLQKLPEQARLRFQAEKSLQVDPEKTLKELAWVSDQDLQWEQLLQLPGFAPDTLLGLKPVLDPSLYDYIVKQGRMSLSEATAAAKALDDGLKEVLKTWLPLKPHLEDAAKVLQNYGAGLTPAIKSFMADPAGHFNEWLELVALVDILGQEHRLLQTLEQASANGYQFPAAEQPILVGTIPPASDARQTTLDQLHADLVQHRADLASGPDHAAATPQSTIPLERLNPEALDKLASAGFFGVNLKTTDRPLSAALWQAVKDQKVQEVHGANSVVVRIGDPSWGMAWEQQIGALSRSLAELAPRFESLKFSELLTHVRSLRTSAETMSKVGKAAQGRLAQRLKQDGPLANAINELVALLTPARWAYEDVISKLNLERASEALDLQESDGVTASLRLNTAELNALALSMFLLCARLAPNPLRLIVLDDPLQNMDELTVTTVARGLGRIMRLWQEWGRGSKYPWRVLLMLHGEENIERIRTEVPSITHFLQWLSPDPDSDLASGRVIIKRQPPLMPNELQNLSNLIFPGQASARPAVG